MKHTIKDEVSGVLVFVGIIWAVFFLDFVVPGNFTNWGLAPRTLWGLIGIPLAPFLHAGFGHLMGNTVPLVVLLVLMAGSRTRTWETVIEIILLGGGLLWLLGRGASVHVGASGLVYGLIAFLIVSGFREKRLVPILISIFVGFLYGSTLFFGVLPTSGASVSWDGHLFGAIAGALLGYFSVGAATETSETPETPSLGA